MLTGVNNLRDRMNQRTRLVFPIKFIICLRLQRLIIVWSNEKNCGFVQNFEFSCHKFGLANRQFYCSDGTRTVTELNLSPKSVKPRLNLNKKISIYILCFIDEYYKGYLFNKIGWSRSMSKKKKGGRPNTKVP